jgi:hypothetical protein
MVVHKADGWEGSTVKSVSESWTGSNEVRQRSLAFKVASVRLNFR